MCTDHADIDGEFDMPNINYTNAYLLAADTEEKLTMFINELKKDHEKKIAKGLSETMYMQACRMRPLHIARIRGLPMSRADRKLLAEA